MYKIQTTPRDMPQHSLCLYTGIKNIWYYHCRHQLKLSAFMASQSELILVSSTYSACGLFTACSVAECSVPVNVLQTTAKSKHNQTHSCQTAQQTHWAPGWSGPSFLLWYFTWAPRVLHAPSFYVTPLAAACRDPASIVDTHVFLLRYKALKSF